MVTTGIQAAIARHFIDLDPGNGRLRRKMKSSVPPGADHHVKRQAGRTLRRPRTADMNSERRFTSAMPA
ncbi:protein of unknown function [Burkholderia multivorans]